LETSNISHIHSIKIILVVVIFIEALSLGLISGNNLRYPDEKDYHELAMRLVPHGYTNVELQPTAYRPPGYPFFLSMLYQLHKFPVIAKVANAIALIIAAWVLSMMASESSQTGAVISLLLLACYPLIPYAASTLYPQILGGTLFIVVIFLLKRSEASHAISLIIGLLFGILILCIPAFMPLLPLILFWLIFGGSRSIRQKLLVSCLIIAGASCIILPWTARNYMQFKAFIPVSTNSGVNLLLGNSENTKANSGVNVDISRYYIVAISSNEVERDTIYKQKAIEWITNNPVPALKLYILKVLNYFNFRNELFVKSESSIRRDATLFITYYPLLLISILRLLYTKRYPITRSESLLYLLYFGNAFISAIFFTRIRMRIPFDFLLICIDALFLGRLMDSFRKSQNTMKLSMK
jgi:hypothetical protein